ncbi:tail length tape measure protein [Pseudorhizobium halotolerans]|uniref:Tail length tape measure protein n=1 Tax=Pseudorhizobium halotolerans TaxID=1233081 RepID=A0ABM8PYY5_9HYPH|nr:phage tail length tape measure family protein [Pseudorhizobium halotolerans]CAD7055469.1 tail length tape measure protein [Pseudorhizobium halotolerans]
MATPLKISARVEIDPSQARQGAAEASRAVDTIGDAAGRTATEMQKLIAASTGLHSSTGNDNIRRWTGALADEGLALDRLRAKYNPLFSVIQNYKQAQIEIRTAHAMGALSADEMSAALQRHRQATLASIDAIKGRNRALVDTPAMMGGSARGFETANIAAQFQDIAVTSAMGMSPLQIALQQGTQLSMVLNQMESPVRGLAAAFMSVINPVSLVTIGVVAAGAAAIQYFSTLNDDSATAKQVLENHTALIARIREAWPQAADGLRAYASESSKILKQEIADQIKALEKSVLDAGVSLRDGLGQFDIRDFGGATFIIGQMRSAMAQLDEGIRSGKPNLEAFVGTLIDIENQSGTPENIRKMIAELRASASSGLEAQRALSPLEGVMKGIGAAAAAEANRVGIFTKALRELSGISVANLTDTELAERQYRLAQSYANNREERDDAYRQFQDTLRRIEDQNPTVINSDGNRTNVPAPGSRPVTLGDKPDKAATATANAYRDLVKSADDRVAQMKLEAELAGQTGVASETLRFKLDLLQQSEEKGRSLSAKQVEAINARVEAFKKYAEAAASAQLKADLLFQREQLGRSAMDQQIASTLRSAGLAVDFDSYEAGLIRTNLQLQYARDLAGDFTSTLFSGLREGKGLWESMGDAAISVLKRISDTLLNDVLNSLFQVNGAASGGSGGGILGALFGGFGSLFGGGTSAFPSAPGGLYDRGGYTGPGGVHEPRGVVHAGEVVWSQRDVARAGGPQVVEAMRLGRRGYNNGGVVDVAPLMSPQMSRPNGAATSGKMQLILKLGLDADSNGNIMPAIREAIAQDAPGIAVEVVKQYDQDLPNRMAEINENPRWR